MNWRFPHRDGIVRRGRNDRRRGAFIVLAFFCLVGVLSFVALSTDLGVVALTKSRMQNAVDAAALAAVQEISHVLQENSGNVGQSGNVGSEIASVTELAEEAARVKAALVAELNGVYVDPEVDVIFGKRSYNSSTDTFSIQWDVEPFNVVKVVARRTNEDTTEPDGMLKLFFAPFMGHDSVAIEASAVAYVDARDLVVVLDFSASMNDDSIFTTASINKLGKSAIEANLLEIWQSLGSPAWGNMPFTPTWVTVPGSSGATKLKVTWKSTSVDAVHYQNMTKADLTFSNGNTQTITASTKTKTFTGTGSNANKVIKKIKVYPASSGANNSSEEFDFYNDTTILKGLGLNNVAYPYNGGSWAQYVQFCRDTSGTYSDSIMDTTGYRNKFGAMTFLDFLMKHKDLYSETNVLWKTPHYPFHAIKEGTTLFTQFLEALEFGDHLGLVSYDTYHRVETTLNMDGFNINISANPITNDYSAIDEIQKHKQAGHYYSTTNIGGGLAEGITLLDNHGRYGARPTILLMTDGIANVVDSDFSKLPKNWSWADMTDYDGDGTADYTTSDKYKQYAFYKAKEAIGKGITIHTMAVGTEADRDFMKAIAFAGGGIFIDVPGGSTIAEMETQMNEAFSRIAANVPPAKLLHDDSGE